MLNKILSKIISMSRSDFTKATKITVQPEEVVETKKTFLPAGHLEKIKATDPMTTLEFEISRITNKITTHAPTILYELSNVQVRPNLIYNEKFFLPLPSKSRKEILGANFNDDPIFIPASFLSQRYFGHFMHDDLPGFFLAKKFNAKYALPYPINYPHATQLMQILSLELQGVHQGKIKKMYISSDFSQNSNKIARYLEVKDQIAHQFQLKCAGNNKCVYIKRGNSGAARILLNEDELINFLTLRGWVIIDPEVLNAKDILNKLFNSKLVMSVEGSALSHTLFSISSEGAIITLQPPRRFASIYKGIFDAMNIRFGIYICSEGLDEKSFVIDDFYSLEKLIDDIQI